MNPLYERRRLLGRNVYKKTVEGNPAIAQGSLARRYPGIGMQGWTEQAQYEGSQLFDISKITPGDIGGSNITIDGEKIIVTNGPGSSGVYPKEPNSLLQYCPNIVAGKSYTLKFDTTGTNKDIYIQGYGAWGSGQTLNITEQILSSKIAFYASGPDTSATISNFMINEGSSALTYEPYTGGQPSPNPDYPQEIVSAGNYDEGSGKYQYTIKISDSEESPTKSQTVILTSDRPLTKWDRLKKRDGVWGWVYKSEEIESYTGESVPGEYYSTTGQLSVGAQVWYETTTETFVPLTASEQEAMNALYTFRPTTVLSNDCECEMTLTYKTKKSLEVTD